MVDGIRSGAGGGGIDDALRRLQARARELGIDQKPSDATVANGHQSFGDMVANGLDAVESKVDRTNELHIDVLEGRLDLHEVAARIKESEISFQFALQVRNKLLDAYREVMRMSV